VGAGADREVLNGRLSARHRHWLSDNLIRPGEFARRKGVDPSTFSVWRARYADFPEPVLPPDSHGGGVYWLPELEAFTARHELPGRRYHDASGYPARHHWKGETT
jgi:hypothetical protein